MATTVTPPGTAAQPLSAPDHATWAGQVYADLRSLDTAVAGAGGWSTVATWSALPVTGIPGQQVRVWDGLGLLVALWDGTAWRVDPASDTGWRSVVGSSGFLLRDVRRRGGYVNWVAYSSAAVIGSDLIWTVPVGWRPPAIHTAYGVYGAASGAYMAAARVDTDDWGLRWYGAVGKEGLLADMSWLTDNAWPTSAPT